MSAQNNELYPDWNQFEEENEKGPSLKEVLGRTLKNWKWLVLSLIIFSGLGVLLVLRTPKSYTENAQIVLRNDSEGSSAVKEFNDIGIFSRNSNVMNEISTMSSPDITEEVVKMLDLTVDYFAPGVFHDKVLYGSNLPVNVSFPDLNEQDAISFKLDFDKNGNYTLTQLKKYDPLKAKWVKSSKMYRGRLELPLKTEFATIVVNPTVNFISGQDYEIKVAKNRLSSTINGYNKKVKIALNDDDSTVIDISITDQNRQRGDEILAAIIAIYNNNWIEEKNQVALSTSQFIEDRLSVIEGELGNVDADISQYKSDNLVPDLTTATKSYLTEQQELSKMTLELQGQIQAARGLRSRLLATGSNTFLPGNTTLDNGALQLQIKEYNDLVAKRNILEQKSSDKNPLVQQIDVDMTQLKEAILSSVDNAIQAIENQLDNLKHAQGTNTGKIATSPKQAKYLLSVERQQKIKENLYLFLLQKREDNELSQAFTAYNTRIIKKPGGDGVPVAPKKSIILVGFFMIGLMIPIGYNYCLLVWDNKVRTRKDFEGISVPLLGEIPLEKNVIKKSKNGKYPQLIVESGKRDVVNEAFRVTRTNIEFARIHKESCNVLAITSFNPGSGKSFVTMNLAASLALKGKKVLVIDGDFRKGTTSEFIDSPNKGLSDYLAGYTNEIKGLIISYPGIENLNILPMGKLPPNPTELIESDKFARLIEDLKKNYDYIMIDCPPIEVVADAQIIDQVADRTIFVIRAGLLEKSLLKELEKFYKDKKYNNITLILNGTPRNKAAYGSSGKYGYGE